jgi:3-demethoxyubiquinol 3-hydroxylase
MALNFLDRVLAHAQEALQCCAGVAMPTQRAYPAEGLVAPALTAKEQTHSAGLMRVDHTGEVCAQALYLGQAAGASSDAVAKHMAQAADEEADHLQWCQQRLAELDSQTSYLNPVWYSASFLLGYIAARCGDAWSLGFVVETERQVEGHLQQHLQSLPAQDGPSRVILQTMMADEVEHARCAQSHGAKALPVPVRSAMRMTAKIMTNLSYWL